MEVLFASSKVRVQQPLVSSSSLTVFLEVFKVFAPGQSSTQRTVTPNDDLPSSRSSSQSWFPPRQGSQRTVEQIIDIPVSLRTRHGGGLLGVRPRQGSTARGGAHAWLRRGDEELGARLYAELDALQAIDWLSPQQMGTVMTRSFGSTVVYRPKMRGKASWLVWTRCLLMLWPRRLRLLVRAMLGFCWCAVRAVFPLVFARPRMLCIMADMDQKDSTLRALVVKHSNKICARLVFQVILHLAVFLSLSSCSASWSGGLPRGLHHGRYGTE